MGFTLVAPGTVAEALALLAPDASGAPVVLAGGTDLLRDLDDGRVAPTRVVSLRRMPWGSISWEGAGVTIGSTRSLRSLELDPSVRGRLPGLWEGIRAVGGVALRQSATLGGNLARASPVSDLIPILLAYDASVAIVGPSGPRRALLTDLLIGPRRTSLATGELIESIEVPRAGPSAYVWQRVRPANDISQVGLAAAFVGDPPTWRVALGGVTPKPVRLPRVEARLGGGRPTPEDVSAAGVEAAATAPFVSDKRASEAYRRLLVAALLRRAVDRILAGPLGGDGVSDLPVRVSLNGAPRELPSVPDDERLLDTLRVRLGLTGTKEGCRSGDCGACTVVVNGRPVLSCLTLTHELPEATILTVEGAHRDPAGARVQRAFERAGAVQCGYCTPGFVMALTGLLTESSRPIEAERLLDDLSGNLCRCTGYAAIVRAVRAVAEESR